MKISDSNIPIFNQYWKVVLIEDRGKTRQIISNAIQEAFPHLNVETPSNWQELLSQIPRENKADLNYKKTLFLTDNELDQEGYDTPPDIFEQKDLTTGLNIAKYLNQLKLDTILYTAGQKVSVFEQDNSPFGFVYKDQLLKIVEGYQTKYAIRPHEISDPQIDDITLDMMLAKWIVDYGEYGNTFVEINDSTYYGSYIQDTSELEPGSIVVNSCEKELTTIDLIESTGTYTYDLRNGMFEQFNNLKNKISETQLSILLTAHLLDNIKKLRIQSRSIEESISELLSDIQRMPEETAKSLCLELSIDLTERRKELTLKRADRLSEVIKNLDLPLVTKIRYGIIEQEIDGMVEIRNKFDLKESRIVKNLEPYGPFKKLNILVEDSFREVEYQVENEKCAPYLKRYEFKDSEWYD